MSDDHTVIVGGSHAAAQLAASLRQEGWQGRISIVSGESMPPYHRPPLSKTYLHGTTSSDALSIRPPSFYEQADIDLVLGSKVVGIDRAGKIITLQNGEQIPYSKLALTTGAKVRKMDTPGHDLEGVCYLRNASDVDCIRQFVGPEKSAVIIGGGYIGLETAASLRKMGMRVTVLEALPRVLQRVTAPELSAFFTRIHREEGVDVMTEVAVETIEGVGTVEAVTCTDGTRINADLVIIGIGVLPETELAEQAGLATDNGIVVDEYARTSDHDIVAAGDCTNHHNAFYDRRIRLESVQNATDQAKTAAKTLCGKLEPYRALPWFWSDQYDVKLQITGLSQGYNRVVVRGSWETGRSFATFYFDADRLLAVDAINRPKEFMLTRRALTDNRSPDLEQLADESIPIQEVFKP